MTDILKQAFYKSKPGNPVFGDFMEDEPRISKENVNVKLPGGLHALVKATAAVKKKTLEKAYEEALRGWLALQGVSQQSPVALKRNKSGG